MNIRMRYFSHFDLIVFLLFDMDSINNFDLKQRCCVVGVGPYDHFSQNILDFTFRVIRKHIVILS